MSTSEKWWLTEYACDIHEHLRREELRQPIFHGQSPQLHYRKYMINWLITVCKRMNVSRTVQHLAVHHMDFFMDNHFIEERQLQLVLLGCILVAGKLEEKDELIPKASKLRSLVEDDRYKLTDFMQIELLLLEFFKWDLLAPTAAHFVDYYSLFALSSMDLYVEHEPVPQFACQNLIKHYINYFLEISLQDHTFLKFPPSLIAASCIAAARICIPVMPPWPAHLQKLTHYRSSHLNPCINKMLRVMNEEDGH